MQEQDQQKNIIEISKRIEAILFWKGEPLNKKDLLKYLKMDEESANILSMMEDKIELAIDELKSNLENRGLCLAQIDDDYTLRTSAVNGKLIEKLQTEELNKDLGKATVETLALIIYKGPIKRSEIDNIRGVNSSYILRNLMIRGLIEKVIDPKNSRVNIYRPSFELLSHLGISNIEDIPNYKEVIQELNKFNEDFNEQQKES